MTVRRLLAVAGCFLVLFGIVLCRVYWISTDTAYAANAGGQTVSETELPRMRGNFYDREGRLLTGAKRIWYALCIPGDSSYSTLFPYVPFEAQNELYEKRNSLSPFLIQVDSDLSSSGVYVYQSAERYLPVPIAPHLIGYLDGEGHGVSGLELAYEDILYDSAAQQAVTCTTTAQGSLLTGTEPELQTEDEGGNQGVQLTLDAVLQRACEGIAQQEMSRGCILVMRVETGEVVASVSVPEFDPDDIAKSIAANDTSLINRPLAAFSAGSVFKLVLALAAYRAGLDWFSYDCEGSVQVADQTFRCALGKAHGTVNLRGALEESCNCYFIKLGELLGAEQILAAAQDLGFGEATAVAPGLKSAAGELPDPALLQSDGQLAMFSFGQGALTVTPLQIAAMTNALADGGCYHTPRFVEGTLDTVTGSLTPLESPEPRTVCEESVANVLCSMMISVVEEGIGTQAQPDEGGAGGKTGTAQTGQYQTDGEELLNYWFTGFWPADDPQYTITVLQDGLLEPPTSSAAIFAQVANALLVLENC